VERLHPTFYMGNFAYNMRTIKYTITTGKERPDLKDISDEIVIFSWPEFMLKDRIANEHWDDLYQIFPEFQFALMETGANNVIASCNSIPLAWDGNPDDLPDGGWDWALAQGFKDYSAGRAPKIQCALSITIPEKYRGRGISVQAVRTMKSIGKVHGFDTMIAPVRPFFKI